ncbi:hypothetical protein [Enterobacter soli]|uniref:hypothetical protein n=1 Tax=Enterobacter soli TaxID=885040 RepID=UPI002F41F3CB
MTKLSRPQRRGFAYKTAISLALEKIVLNGQIRKLSDQPVSAPVVPAGGYVQIYKRLRDMRNSHMVSLAWMYADVTDKDALNARMSWLSGSLSVSADTPV